MKPLDPDKCPTMVKVLDALCYLHDAQGRGVTSKQVTSRSGKARYNVIQALRMLLKKGYVHREKVGHFGSKGVWATEKTIRAQYDLYFPLYRSNGEPYKRDMSLAEPVKTKGTKTICEPGYARGYKISPVTVRPTAPYKPSTEGMW